MGKVKITNVGEHILQFYNIFYLSEDILVSFKKISHVEREMLKVYFYWIGIMINSVTACEEKMQCDMTNTSSLDQVIWLKLFIWHDVSK